jgi:hypothetical protein
VCVPRSASIEASFALEAGSVAKANTFVTCTDIWQGTTLSICVPTLAPTDPQGCTKNVAASGPTTCAGVATTYGTTAAWIKAWNPVVNCADIWAGTPLCVAH